MLEKYLPRIKFDSYEDFKENYKINVPEDFNFGFDIVDAWADSEPEKIALDWRNDKGESHIFTFKDLKESSNKIANYIKGLGLKKNDTVMLILKRRYEYWMIATALHKLGVVLIPASFQLTPKDINYRCKAASVDMLICVEDAAVIANAEEGLKGITTVKHKLLVESTPIKKEYTSLGWIDFHKAIEGSSNILERPTGEEATKVTDRFLMYFTSGTTGMPKMSLHDYSYPLGHVVTAKYWHQVEENQRHLTISDSGWAKFGWGKIYGQWICGAVQFVYDHEKFIPEQMLKMIEEGKLTTFCAPPTMYRFFIKEDLTKYDLSTLHHCSIAGEPLNPEVYNQFLKTTGHKLYEGFGQTESSVLIANFEWFEPRPGSMGKPSPLYDIAIINENGERCELGEEGEIVIMDVKKDWPVGLFKEYYLDPEANEKAFYDGNYHTGDVAWYDSDGYYWFVGRLDDVIKCSGYRIGPFEVESALMEHPSVLECAVTAAPDSVRGQVVKATIVLANGYEPSDELAKELQNHVKNVTAPYKYPRIVEFVKEFEKTTSGKIMRRMIREKDSKN